MALLLCGYLHDTNAFPIVREATSQLFKPLLRARVFGLGRAGSLQTLSTNLAQDVTFERFVQNAIASLGIGGARPNDICSTLQFIASTLATCGAVDTAAVTVKDAVKAARGREAARYSVAAEGLSNYLWTLFPTGPSVPAMLAITRLLALVAFPDPERRPTILENCLKPLVTELNHVRLSPDLQYELREIVAAA